MQPYFTARKPTRSSRKPIPIFSNGKVVGKVSGETFVKRLYRSRHFLRIPPAICFAVSSLDDAELAGAKLVEIFERESGAIYRAPIELIRSRGIRVCRKHGEQIGLPLAYWSINGQPAKSLSEKPANPEQPRLL